MTFQSMKCEEKSQKQWLISKQVSTSREVFKLIQLRVPSTVNLYSNCILYL